MKIYAFTNALLIIAFFLLGNTTISGQTAPFNILIEPLEIQGLGGIHSYSFGQHNGKWLIAGGRLDGLHQRQPFAAFDIAGHNTQLIVVDPETQQKWAAPLTSLPIAMQEQLSSTNMQFFQNGDQLYITGGYGYSTTAGDHTTFGSLIAIEVPSVIDAIINNIGFAAYFRQIDDPKFALTGGQLEKIYDTYYLVGGHKFIGRYNPMGPDHGPGFIQEYSDQIRKFTLTDDGATLSIVHFPAITDTVNLHRRDYNLSPQILPDRQEGLTAFSGVFQHDEDLPFLNCVNIDSSGYNVNNSFTQYYNHYHCANVPLYSDSDNEMHHLFFGGIAQYYDSLGTLVQDNDVPFVKTIARVSRDANGVMSEYKLPIEMPALLGAGSEFIANESLPKYENDVLKIDDFTADTTLLGYIYGGINSNDRNIFFINNGNQSSASSQIFKVYLIKDKPLAIHHLNEHSIGTLKLTTYPNPNNGNFRLKFNIEKPSKLKISLYDMDGSKIYKKTTATLTEGNYTFDKYIKAIAKGGIYLLVVETDYEKVVQKLIITP